MTIELNAQDAHPVTVSASQTDMGLLEYRIERLKTRMHIAVIYGGDKSLPDSVVYQSHNTRSWKSYEAVANDIATALRRLGFRHVELMPEDMRLGDRLRRRRIHLAWLNTGGVQGYNPVTHAPSMLEMMGVPYVGHDPLAATMLDNKHTFKRAALCAGLPTPAFMTWHLMRSGSGFDFGTRFKRAFGDYPGPFVVKPVSGRASLHVHVVPDAASLPDVVAEVYHATENAVLIERFVSGREVCVAVAGPVTAPGGRFTRATRPTAFATMERVLVPGEQIFTSMDKRPITSDRVRLVDRDKDAKLIADMQRLACETYLDFNLCSVIRLDLRADENGELFILEANPKPDLKAPANGVTSLICAGLDALGMSYDDLILSLLADRLDYLFTHRAGSVNHLLEMIETPNLFDLMGAASLEAIAAPLQAAAAKADDAKAMLINEIATDLCVMALRTTLAAAKQSAVVAPAPPRPELNVNAA